MVVEFDQFRFVLEEGGVTFVASVDSERRLSFSIEGDYAGSEPMQFIAASKTLDADASLVFRKWLERALSFQLAS